MTAAELETLLHQQIPITEAMQLQVLSCAPDAVCLRAPLTANRNLHGTAFAGSLYSLATLTGWSLVTLFARSHGYDGALVLRTAQVGYQRPVSGDLEAQAHLPEAAEQQAFLDGLQRKGRGRLSIHVQVLQAGKPAFSFQGEFVLNCTQGADAH